MRQGTDSFCYHKQPFVSTVGIAWTAYLSLTNASEEAATPATALDSPNIRLE